MAVNSTAIDIDLNFKDSYKVSQEAKSNQLIVQLGLENFKDEYGQSLPPCLLFKEDLPI